MRIRNTTFDNAKSWIVYRYISTQTTIARKSEQLKAAIHEAMYVVI